MRIPRSQLCLGLLACLVAAGCTSRDPNRLPTKPVQVVVIYQGKAVEGAIILFADESGVAPASGRTDARGYARMKTYVEGDGAVFGKHRVAISKAIDRSPPVADIDSPDYVPPEVLGWPEPIIEWLIPRRYSTIATSGLEVVVSEDGPSEFRFELTEEDPGE